MDEADRAKVYEQQDRNIALNNATHRPAPPKPRYNNDGALICLDCGASISTLRLKAYADAVRCVPCKTHLEEQQKRT